MKRIIDHFLMEWKGSPLRQPLILRGARQIGKTYSVRKLGATFSDFVEINFELHAEAELIFEKNLNPERILRELSLIARKRIIPGKTLLFLDEIQIVPKAITALRYFYEMLPELHVIAAGSLLDFTIEQIGIPVGRVQSLYMHPVSFIEFLVASGETLMVDEVMNHSIHHEIGAVVHERLIDLLGEYLALGGMPHSLQSWIDTQNPLACSKIHQSLLDTYRQDFGKYTRKLQIKYVELIFSQVPMQLGKKFKYSDVDGDYRKRELSPALELLVTAGIVHQVFYTAGQGVPLGSQLDVQDYRAIFLDVGLAQTSLGLDLSTWFLNPVQAFVNKGALIESFVGQELLAYSNPYRKNPLYYWHKESRAAQAEIDYLISIKSDVIPIEVKAGLGSTLKSLHYFLEKHPLSPYGIRFSAQNYSVHDNVHSYPLYAIAHVLGDENAEIRQAIEHLIV
jgi:predicted AAA+ superfamily ATPase